VQRPIDHTPARRHVGVDLRVNDDNASRITDVEGMMHPSMVWSAISDVEMQAA
jgi:hypothetical protein